MSFIKKNLSYISLFIFLGLVIAIPFFRKKEKVFELKERTGAIALSGEWLNTKAAVNELLAEIRQRPDDIKAKLALAQAYIQEARITGDHPYYDMAAVELLNQVLRKDPENFEALCCKSSVYLSQHHFSEGLEIAKTAVAINPDNAFVYGLLCDANVELGNYPEAVKMADKMVSVRPDLRSYSRVSYLREIHGETKGAVEAMKMAVSAGYPGLEQTEWARVMLGHLYENQGDLNNAELQYSIALQERPDYAFAIAGLSRIERAKGNYKKAIEYMEQAKGMMREYSFQDELTDLYALNGENDKAHKSAKAVIEMLSGDAKSAETNQNIGHYADRELAYAYLKTSDYKPSLEHAEIEYKRRPDNIDVCETLAWVKYKTGDYKGAEELIKTALRTHSQNPVLLCRAGLIEIKAGNKSEGSALIKKAIEKNPYLNYELAFEAKPYLVMN